MKVILIFISFILITSFSFAENNLSLMLESGAVWQNRNDTKISPTTGTRIALDEFSDGPDFHYRMEAYYKINTRHSLRLVYAPLNISVGGRRATDTVFNDTRFSTAEDLDIEYKFNSYRISYIYSFWDSEDDKLNLGITAKIRDAKTTFAQTGLSSTYDNIGFVPLIYFEFQKALAKKWKINLTLDGAYASQGRAIDAALKLRRDFSEKSSLGLGFRTLEGGAENEKVYTFSWFTYAVADLVIEF